MSDPTPAGWYPAPHANNQLRYWDGAAWHDQVPAPTGAPVATQEAPLGGTPNGGGRPATQGLAIAALITGIVAFLIGLIPFFGLLVAIAAVVLAVLALRKKQQRVFSLIGLILGGIALLTGIIVVIVFSVGAGNRTSTVSSGEIAGAPVETSQATPSPLPTQTPSAASSPTESPAPVEAPAAPPADQGAVANPYPQPYVAKGFLGGEKYSLTGSIVDANASALVEEWNQFNDDAPAGFKYVVVQLTMTGIDKDGVEPSLAEFDLSLATAEGNRYDSEFVIFGDGMPAMSDGPTLYPGSSFTGFTAYIVPDSAQSFLIFDNGNYVALA